MRERERAKVDLTGSGFPPISSAPDDGGAQSTWYASADDKGRVWLIKHPAHWPETYDDKGRRYRHRPSPVALEDAAINGIFPSKKITATASTQTNSMEF